MDKILKNFLPKSVQLGIVAIKFIKNSGHVIFRHVYFPSRTAPLKNPINLTDTAKVIILPTKRPDVNWFLYQLRGLLGHPTEGGGVNFEHKFCLEIF